MTVKELVDSLKIYPPSSRVAITYNGYADNMYGQQLQTIQQLWVDVVTKECWNSYQQFYESSKSYMTPDKIKRYWVSNMVASVGFYVELQQEIEPDDNE